MRAQTQRKWSLEGDAFAAQNPAEQDSYSLFGLCFSCGMVQWVAGRIYV